MRRRVPTALAVACIGLAASAALRASCAEDHPGADEVWSTKKVMVKVGAGRRSLLSVVDKDLQKAEPDWKSDEANLTEIIRLMAMLTRQKPPRGSQEAWDKLVRDFVDGAKAARQHVKEHRLQPACDALETARSTCEECHDSHGLQ
jgi:hypothetical protein